MVWNEQVNDVKVFIQNPFEGPGGLIKRVWIIVLEPGHIPTQKTPHPQTEEGVLNVLKQLDAISPKGTTFVVAMLTSDGDLQVASGQSVLEKSGF